jgi:hypothetical protein
MSELGGFTMGSWEWAEEIAAIHSQRQKEYNADLAKKNTIYTKDGKVYIEAVYFEELAKQMKPRVSIIASSFPRTETHYYITQVGYERLIKYLPLPPWKDLKIQKG